MAGSMTSLPWNDFPWDSPLWWPWLSRLSLLGVYTPLNKTPLHIAQKKWNFQRTFLNFKERRMEINRGILCKPEATGLFPVHCLLFKCCSLWPACGLLGLAWLETVSGLWYLTLILSAESVWLTAELSCGFCALSSGMHLVCFWVHVGL